MEAWILACVFLCVGSTFPENEQIFHGLKHIRKSPFRFPQHIDKTDLGREISILRNKSKYGVDGDPDFIVAVRGLNTSLCFHVGGEQGEVLRLVQHTPLDLFVNAKIIERNETQKRYLGSVAILRHNVKIFASRRGIVINRHPFTWTTMNAFLLHGHRIIIGQNLLAITYRNKNVTLVIRRHVLQPSEADDSFEDEINDVEGMVNDADDITPGNEEFIYLGFYIADSRGLNQQCHGLLGQFVHKRVTVDHIRLRNGKQKVRMRVFSPGYHVARVVIATSSSRQNLGTETLTECLWVRREGEGVIDGNYIDYIVSDIRNKDIIQFQ